MKMKELVHMLGKMMAALMLFAFLSTAIAGEGKKSAKVHTPDEIEATKTEDNNVKLSWAAVSDAEQYKIYRADLTESELKKHYKTEMKKEAESSSMSMSSEKKMSKSEHKKIDIDKINQEALNFREIGTTTNTQFVDRTVDMALRTQNLSGTENYARVASIGSEHEKSASEMSSMKDIVFLYSVSALDDEGNESPMSDLTKINFDKSKSSEKEQKQKAY